MVAFELAIKKKKKKKKELDTAHSGTVEKLSASNPFRYTSLRK